MTRAEATQFVRVLVWALIRIRSITVESIGGFGADMTKLEDSEKTVLNSLYPCIFTIDELYNGAEPEYSLLKHAMAVEAKGDDLEPIDLYNLLIAIYRDTHSCAIVSASLILNEEYREIEYYVDRGIPSWVAGWKEA